jgi:uncharacterized protein YbjQ (UPF0145 family)
MATHSAPHLTGLSGNEIYCLRLKGLRPQGVLVGNSVQSMGLLGGLRSAFRGIIGGEVPAVTQVIHDGREAAFQRLVAEAQQEGVTGIVGVSSDLRALANYTEFLFVGSGVHSEPKREPFTSAGDAQELYCHMDAGYEPVHFVFGNIAYSVGAVGGLMGALRTLARGEIKEFSDVFNETRHQALGRLASHAASGGANAVVGIRTHILRFAGFHEMYMTGTAARHPSLSIPGVRTVATSDLTGEELWSLTSLGYVPLKLLISTSVYSLGVVGGVMAALKGFARGEISELTSLVYEAREQVFDRIEREAKNLGADQVVGIKTYVIELGASLIEIFAVGTAVRQLEGVQGPKVASQSLPAQAIIRDRDTWIDGEIALDTTSIRAGGR